MELKILRKQIDKLDEQILEVLAERFEVVKKIDLVKKRQDFPVFDFTREKHLFKRIEGISQKLHLNKKFTKTLFGLIITESKRLQENKK